jgi:hypothetical protein
LEDNAVLLFRVTPKTEEKNITEFVASALAADNTEPSDVIGSLQDVVFSQEPGKVMLIFNGEPGGYHLQIPNVPYMLEKNYNTSIYSNFTYSINFPFLSCFNIFHSDYDALRRHCVKFPLNGKMVQVQRVPECKSIQVFEYTKEPDFLELFFENEAEDSVVEVEQHSDHYILTFESRAGRLFLPSTIQTLSPFPHFSNNISHYIIRIIVTQVLKKSRRKAIMSAQDRVFT